jgi:HlyD family secretion protein
MTSTRSHRVRRVGIVALLVTFGGVLTYVALRSGPLAPVPVTLVTVASRAVTPSLFGLGTVEARFSHRVGAIAPGRLLRVDVEPGDRVRAGATLGQLDPVDLDARIAAQDAALARAQASLVSGEAQVREAEARLGFAVAQLQRYEQLVADGTVSREAYDARHHERQVADAARASARAGLDVARQEIARVRADRDALARQRATLRLVSPIDGVVSRREADPGTTVVAGQLVVEVIDQASIWLSVRFDQQRALGLRAGLPARIVLRSHSGGAIAGRVIRIEPRADAVTEEVLAKVAFEPNPTPMPPTGELVEVTVTLGAVAPRPAIPNAAVHRVDGRLGVWTLDGGRPHFVPVTLGAGDLEGWVQVLEGLTGGEQVIAHSQRPLTASSRVTPVTSLVGTSS